MDRRTHTRTNICFYRVALLLKTNLLCVGILFLAEERYFYFRGYFTNGHQCNEKFYSWINYIRLEIAYLPNINIVILSSFSGRYPLRNRFRLKLKMKFIWSFHFYPKFTLT